MADDIDVETKIDPVRRQVVRGAIAAATAASASALSLRPLYAAAAKPEITKAVLGFIALTDASPLIIAKEKGFFAKYGMPDVEVTKQASWGTTRDNLVLGSAGSGIDGAHILTPMPYLISSGKVTQNNVPTPMYVLARLNLDSQAISVAAEYADLELGLDARPFKVALEKKRAAGAAPLIVSAASGEGVPEVLRALAAQIKTLRSHAKTETVRAAGWRP